MYDKWQLSYQGNLQAQLAAGILRLFPACMELGHLDNLQNNLAASLESYASSENADITVSDLQMSQELTRFWRLLEYLILKHWFAWVIMTSLLLSLHAHPMGQETSFQGLVWKPRGRSGHLLSPFDSCVITLSFQVPLWIAPVSSITDFSWEILKVESLSTISGERRLQGHQHNAVSTVETSHKYLLNEWTHW